MSHLTAAPGVAMRRAAPVRGTAASLAAAVVMVAVVTVVGGVLVGGAAEPAGLLDPGALVRWGLPVVTVLLYLAATTTVGGLVLCAVVLPPAGVAWQRSATLGAVAAIAWAGLQALHLLLLHASVIGTPVGGPGFLAVLLQFLTGVELGATLSWAVVLTGLTAVLAVLAATPAAASWAAAAAAIALVPLAGVGHAAGAGSHELAVSAMWMHLVAVGLWTGGLTVLLLATIGARERVAAEVGRFSAVAGWAVVLVVVSGVANAWVRVGSPLDLLTTRWGQLLTVKVLAFAVLGLAGWWHRRSTIPLLDRDGRAWPFWRLVLVEVLVMAGVVGVSVALGSTAPPVPQTPQAEAADYASLPEPWFGGLLTQWRIDPLFLFLAGAGLWVYVSWVLRLRRRGDSWPVQRTVAWVAGMVLFAWTTSGGPAAYGHVLFSVHMLQHMALISVVPLLLATAAPVSLAVRALPRRRDGTTGPRELLLSLVQSRWATFFAHPVVAALNVVVSMAVFYFSPLFELALRSHVAHVAMVVHFSLVGYLFANVVVGTDPGPRRPPYPVRLVLLLPSMVFHTFFGLLVISSTSLLAADHFTALAVPWTDPLTDQQVGGAVAWAMGELPALGLAVVVALRWAAADERARRRQDVGRARTHA